MAILSAANLTMGFGENELFADSTFEIYEHDKVGVIGANGTGKTTLFKLITGELQPTAGQIVKSKLTNVGYMHQHALSGSERSIYDEVLSVFSSLMQTEIKLKQLSDKLHNSTESDITALIAQQDELTEAFHKNGGLTYKSRAKSTLTGLGFSEKEFTLTCSQLSGGQRSKLSLAKLLLSEPDLLLLDEPTNHLDMGSVQWLENFMREYSGTALIVSHDRYFLDRVTSKTLELHHGKFTLFKGNYSAFTAEKKRAQEILAHQYRTKTAEIKRIEGIIAQQRQWNRERTIRMAESKQKMLDKKIAELEIPDAPDDTVHFSFKINSVSGNDVLFIDSLKKSFGEKKLFENVSFHLYRKDKMFLLGPNGCGKTTMLKILTGQLPSSGGEFYFGTKVKVGYFDQTLSGLHNEKTVLDEVWDKYKEMDTTSVRNALAAFLFKGDEVYKKISDLSGGEKARICLLKLMLSGANLLLLDEPTNHLDISAREALEDALLDYDGTMLVVSHDRYFVNKIANKILAFSPVDTKVYDGDYDTYLEKIEQEKQNNSTQKNEEKPNTYRQKKQQEKLMRMARTRLKKCEEQIEQNDVLISQTNEMLADETISSDYEKIVELTQKLDELEAQQVELMNEWEEISIELE